MQNTLQKGRALLAAALALVLAIGLCPAVPAQADELQPQASQFDITTKVTMGTITASGSHAAGSDVTVNYAPTDPDTTMLYRVSVNGEVVWIDADHDGNADEGSQEGADTSYTFKNLQVDSAISVIYAPKPGTGASAPVRLTVNGQETLQINPYTDTDDPYVLDYLATLTLPAFTAAMANQYADRVMGLEVAITGTYDACLDTTDLRVTAVSEHFEIVPTSIVTDNGQFSATIRLKDPANTVDWAQPIVASFAGVKLSKADAALQSGGQLVTIGSYSGMLSTNISIVGNMAVGGYAENAAIVEVAQEPASAHDVFFNANGHGTDPAPQTGLNPGDLVTAPTAPTAAGWTFSAWYTDPACTAGNEWKFATDVMPNRDLNLYAKWVKKDDIDLTVARIFGDNRFSTASAVAQYGRTQSDVVFLASGEDRNWPDALTAAGAAGLEKAPIVLTPFGSKVGSDALTAIKALNAKKVIICGGASAVSSDVEKQLKGAGYTVSRLGGDNRMQTAEAIYDAYKGQWTGNSVIVCTGKVFADALSVSPYSYATHSPILLTDFSGDDLTVETRAAIKSCTATQAIICGGTSAVGSNVEKVITAAKPALGAPNRLFGATRYETSVKIAQYETTKAGFTTNRVAFARGQSHADALVGGALQGMDTAPLILVDADQTSMAQKLLTAADGTIEEMRFFGGDSAVSPQTCKLLIESIHYKAITWAPTSAVALSGVKASNPTA